MEVELEEKMSQNGVEPRGAFSPTPTQKRKIEIFIYKGWVEINEYVYNQNTKTYDIVRQNITRYKSATIEYKDGINVEIMLELETPPYAVLLKNSDNITIEIYNRLDERVDCDCSCGGY
jgi:hypothetical protein